MKRVVMFAAVCLLAGVASAATGKSAAFPVDLREGDRVSAGSEELTFSNLWDGDADATVTIAQDGAAIFTGLTGEGLKTWTVDRNGRYELTHTTYTNGVPGKVETAVFVVGGKDVPVRELTVEWETGSFMYDNTGKTPGVTAKNGETLLVKGVDYTVRYEGNTNAGTAKAILTGLPPYVGSVTNEFAIAKRLVKLTSGTDSKAYDGTPLVCHSVTTNGDGFVAGEGVDFSFTGSQTIAGSSKNTFDYTFKTGTLAGNYTITKTEGNLTVNAATIYDEPGPGPVPVGGLSKFDATYVYDGEGHTINTQELYAVTLVGSTPSFSFSLDGETGWQNDPFVYTNVGEYVMWYKITAPNYADYKHQAKVTIRPLVLTVTFDANGGSCPMASKTVTHGATYGTLPTPTWAGHIFAGWYTAASGGDEVKDSTTVSIMAPQTLCAHWVSVKSVTAKQRYPWNGLVDIVVAFEGEANDVAKVDCSFIATNSATKAALSVASITRKGADSGKDNAWSRQFVWDAGADVGAVKIDDVVFTVAARIPAEGGVQLWENGPYWAECNVGATKPEECGYYFWWGDTVGYERVGDGWNAVDESRAGFSFSYENCPTYNKSNSSLESLGWIDSAGVLVAKYDAATAKLGEPWRMPMGDEIQALVDNCTTTWTTRNGVNGCLVTGKGAFASKCIFLPAVGRGDGSSLNDLGSRGDYWSSVNQGSFSGNAKYIDFYSSNFRLNGDYRYRGRAVRPVRGFADMLVGDAVTTPLSLDCRTGDRVSAGSEELTFSNLWDGDVDATVTIAQDGAAILTGLTGEGLKTWTVDRNGRYELTHTTYTNGVPGKVETAVFVVEGKEVPVGELTVEWETGSFMYDNTGKTPGVTAKNGETLLVKGVDYTVRYEGNTNAGTAKAILTGLPPYVGSVTNEFAIAKRLVELTSGTDSKAYDGTPLVCHSVTTNGDGFVSGEGVDFTFSGSQTIVGSSKNTFDYTFKTGTLAGNYTITKTEGDLKVTSGEIVNPFDPDDPTNPATSEDLAKANCITNYDGDGHSVEVAAFLNPLIVANNPQITYSLLRDGTYEAQKPVFTNVVSTSVWYRIEADNFNLFTTNALLKIWPRSITNVNVVAIADQTYTGFGVEPIPAVTDMRTLIGMSEPTDILSSADYDLSYLNNTNVGTAKVVLSGKNNYEGSQTNTFQIVPAIIPPGPSGAIVATGYTNAYDGAAHGVSVSVTGLKTQPTVQYKGSPSAEWQDVSPTYTDVCDTQVWWRVSAPNYQSIEGMIGLKIRQAANAWTTEPAIEGWTYGETAKTPVGAAKFGAVSFAYDPMPVGAAGDYTMTATVAGTANYTGLSKTVGFTISKATLPGGGEEPGGGTVPEGGLSKFDAVAMYDGEGHTIRTNDLVAAFKAAVGGDVTVEYAYGGAGVPALPWLPVAPDFTNVCETSVWYKVTSANYLDYVHAAKVAITNRPVTIASGTESFDYDGNAHSNMTVAVGGEGFVAGEGVKTNDFATITEKGSKPNAFDYELILNPGSVAENYSVTCVTGTLTVVAVANAWIVEPTVTGKAYDGTPAAVTMGTPKFGTVSVTYDGGQTAAPVGAGDHTAKFVVAATADYGALEKVINYTITKATLPGGGEEPGGGTVPAGGASKFDTVAMYDGEGHTIRTNEMRIAFAPYTSGEDAASPFRFAASSEGPWGELPTVVTNVGTTSVWYKFTSANYEDFTHEAKVTVTNRPVTLTSGTKLDFVYDGKPHAYTNLTVTAGSFVAGEGIATSNWATVTTLAEGPVPNAFDFEAEGGTLLSNYDLTVVTGKIAVVSPDAVVVTVTGHVASVVYDGLKKSVSGYDIVSISDPLYTAADFTVAGQSSTNGTNVGTYPMGLKSSDFVNTNPNFASVVFNVTDGMLVIAQAENAWTTEPAIDGWTYGETAKTPVGAAKFGAVSFTYDPMPVGAAGDYTMTATVAGTANYTGLSKTVDFAIAKATLPGGGEEPGGGEKPEGGASKFDTVVMYDGEGHTIKTNDLVMAFRTAIGNDFAVSYALDESGGLGQPATPWSAVVPTYTNVGESVVWYRVTSANYEDFVHEAKVTVTNRPVTLTSGTKLDFAYDGKPHAYTNLTVTAGSFVAGEGIATSNWATVTTVAEGEAPNAFDYEPLDGTKLSNYALTVVTGRIAVVSPDAVVVTIAGHVASVVYDGLKKSVSGYDIVSISDPLYTAADFKFTGQSSTNGTNAGTYPMGLKSAGFVNTNPNFATVVFNVTDGELVIAQAANAWTTEPAIDGWTYGETAKTPVGAAKFGEVSFAYDPMPVNAAGDYTMTATVAGTANYTGLSKTVDFAIAKATLPGGGEEPGGGEKPEGGASKFDVTVMYDGEGHTIATNELVAAFKAAVGGDVAVSYAKGEGGGLGQPATPWNTVAPAYTNVGESVVWYKVTSANYEDFVHEAKVTVTNRPVTLTSGTKTDFAYDGKPHAYTNLTVTAGSFVAGEGIATSNWATVTAVAEGEVPNAFDFEAEEGTLLSNYNLTVVTGMIAVVSPDAVVVTVTGHVASVTYDGTKKSVSGYDVVSISDPLYTSADFKYTGQSSTNGTNAGTYPMGLKSAGFVNTNPNFATVVFNVTDGSLVIAQVVNAWTTVPAIESWTYGETAKTPVGAAKFGEVAFAYSPMPVGAAGDYTMTATVAGTANYTGLSKTVAFTVEKATLPGSGEEPGGGEKPEGGVSKFDVTVMYDGEGHTIATNELVVAFKAAVGGDVAVSYACGGAGVPALPWMPVAPDFTNVCETSLWYKVTSANYEDFVHEAKVMVTNRPVTLTSGTKADFAYDGKPHAYTNLTVTAGSFVAGEGIVTSNWATVTTVAEGKVPNAFDYAAQEGTLLSNYALTVVTGEIAIVSPDAVVVTITGHVASVVYDGLKKSVSGYDIVSISDPLYTAADFKFTGQSSTNGTNAGTYPMGLKSAGFVNTNPNFATVVFNVTDGELVIAQAANAWTTEPAIDGWTYGETAKTPVGAAKFGAVSFAYDPMPVGAAGDYTMTATVAGTANYTGLSKTVDFTIAKAKLPDEEPGGGEKPEGGASKFDVTVMYDGGGHTIKTNDLIAAFRTIIGNDFAISYTMGESGGLGQPALPPMDAGAWMAVAPDFTNVCVTSVWYKVASANYQDFVHEAKVTVTNRPVTFTSGTETFDYDGNAHSNMTVTVSGEGFVAGEGVTSNNFATITEKGSKPNAFGYELILNPGSVAENYRVTCVTGTLMVASAANLWLVEPMVTGKAYDGMPAAVTMGTPKFGTVSVTYDGGQTAAPVVAGNHSAKFAVAATADYGALEKVVNYTITKAAFPGGGEEPGGGTVPEGGVSKFDTVAMYDGVGHTIKTNDLVAVFKAAVGGDVVVCYAAGDGEGAVVTQWLDVAPDFTNVCVTSVWYKVTSANYQDFTHEAKVTVTPRDIAKATVANIPDQQHTGTAIKPPVTVTDGNPTIITSDDYTVAYSDNIAIGQATVTLTGKRNYTGTKTVHFMIKGSSAAALKAEIAWKLLKASGTYMAQLKVTCTSGLSTGITNLRFMFADRVSGGTTYASLWDTPKRAAKSTTMPYSGDTYRYVALDASRITAENVAVTYGVRSLAATSIPTAERTIELYVRKRVNPTTGKEEAAGVDNFVGYLSWTSGGETSYLPIVAGAQAASFSKAALRAPAPMKLAAVNAALAVGSVIAEGSSPYCKLTEFTVGDNEITGVVEVGAVSSDGAEYPGKLGPNATVTLLGTNDLGRDFKVICSVTTDNAGRFRLATPKDCQFFKLKLTVEEVVE